MEIVKPQTTEPEPIPKSILDARIEAQKLRTLYNDDPRQQSFRALITGETGSGKTYLLRTARKPVHIDSFDPGGTLGLQDEIVKGNIVVDTRYEREDREHPTMFREWVKNFEHRVRSKYFESFGTYCLDSSTLWAESIMNHVLLQDNRPGTAPKFTRDYVPQKVQIQNCMRRILDLPCDVIVTGHLQGVFESKVVEGEEVRVLTGMRYMTTGQGMILIPLMFDELWVSISKERGSGTEYKLVTSKYQLYQAKTRIGAGKFSTLENPDIKELLKKCGRNIEDKPKLF